MNIKVKPHHYNVSQLACCQPLLRGTQCHERGRVQTTCLEITRAHQAAERCSAVSPTIASTVLTAQQYTTCNKMSLQHYNQFFSAKFVKPFRAVEIKFSITNNQFMLHSSNWLQWGTPHLPQNYPLPRTNGLTQITASSLDPSDLPLQTTSISDQPFCQNALDIQTDTHT